MSKLCPLKSHESFGIMTFGTCEQSRCGWWSTYHNECAVNSIGAVGFALMQLKKESGINVKE